MLRRSGYAKAQQVVILGPLRVVHQFSGFQGNARGERPQVVELRPAYALAFARAVRVRTAAVRRFVVAFTGRRAAE